MSNSKYDLVIFDLDGTLLDTSAGVISSVKYTIEYFGFQMPPEPVLQSFIGPPIQDSFARVYNLSGDILQDIATVFRNRYKDVDLCKAIPYAGIFDTIDTLRKSGVKTAVATYKREDYALTLLSHFGFDKVFDVIHGGDHNNILKKSDIVNLCISETGVTDKDKVVLIGDTENDEKGALTNGIDFIAVTYGFGYKDNKDHCKSKAIGFANSTGEILNFII